MYKSVHFAIRCHSGPGNHDRSYSARDKFRYLRREEAEGCLLPEGYLPTVSACFRHNPQLCPNSPPPLRLGCRYTISPSPLSLHCDIYRCERTRRRPGCIRPCKTAETSSGTFLKALDELVPNSPSFIFLGNLRKV